MKLGKKTSKYIYIIISLLAVFLLFLGIGKVIELRLASLLIEFLVCITFLIDSIFKFKEGKKAEALTFLIFVILMVFFTISSLLNY